MVIKMGMNVIALSSVYELFFIVISIDEYFRVTDVNFLSMNTIICCTDDDEQEKKLIENQQHAPMK